MDSESEEILILEHRIADELHKLRVLLMELETKADIKILPVWFNLTLFITSVLEMTEQVSSKLRIRNEVGELLKNLKPPQKGS
jgi:hypothetical protein